MGFEDGSRPDPQPERGPEDIRKEAEALESDVDEFAENRGVSHVLNMLARSDGDILRDLRQQARELSKQGIGNVDARLVQIMSDYPPNDPTNNKRVDSVENVPAPLQQLYVVKVALEMLQEYRAKGSHSPVDSRRRIEDRELERADSILASVERLSIDESVTHALSLLDKASSEEIAPLKDDAITYAYEGITELEQRLESAKRSVVHRKGDESNQGKLTIDAVPEGVRELWKIKIAAQMIKTFSS